jgi:hypothetical protein
VLELAQAARKIESEVDFAEELKEELKILSQHKSASKAKKSKNKASSKA